MNIWKEGELDVDIQERMKQLRKEKKITQEQLARTLDIPESTIRRIESYSNNSTPPVERLEVIANYFGVTIDYLLGRSDFRNESTAQAMNDVMKAYSRLPRDKQKAVDDLIRLLDQ